VRVGGACDIKLLFAIWEQNVETVRALNRSLKQDALPKSGIAPHLVSHLKQCAIALVKPGNRVNGEAEGDETIAALPASARPKMDKSALTISEPKRIRCYALWQVSLASFAGARLLTHTMCATRSPAA
jgi:hypothetical protein